MIAGTAPRPPAALYPSTQSEPFSFLTAASLTRAPLRTPLPLAVHRSRAALRHSLCAAGPPSSPVRCTTTAATTARTSPPSAKLSWSRRGSAQVSSSPEPSQIIRYVRYSTGMTPFPFRFSLLTQVCEHIAQRGKGITACDEGPGAPAGPCRHLCPGKDFAPMLSLIRALTFNAAFVLIRTFFRHHRRPLCQVR